MEKKDYYNCTFAFNESSPSQLMSSSSSPSNLIEKDLLSSFMDSKYEDTGVDVNLSLRPPELPVKKCQMCGETDTPLWRNGPHGPKTACNACGIRFRKTKEKLNTDLILALPRPKKQRCSRNKELKHA